MQEHDEHKDDRVKPTPFQLSTFDSNNKTGRQSLIPNVCVYSKPYCEEIPNRILMTYFVYILQVLFIVTFMDR